MDDRLARALDSSAYQKTLNNQKRNIRARADVVSKVTYNGGSFTANAITISYAATMNEKYSESEYIILDDNERPVSITNKEEFLNELMNAQQQAMNEYKREYQKLIRSRNVKKLIGEK